VISKPSLATIRSIFQDGNTPAQDDPSLAGVSGYVVTSVGGGENLVVSEFSFAMAADDSTQRLISNGETVQIIGGTGITTASDAEGNITITASAVGVTTFSALSDVTTASIDIGKIYEPAIAMLRVDNVGTSAYTFPSHYSGNNPTIYAISGTTLAFDLDLIPGHPFEIQDNTLTALTSNLVHVSADGTVSTDSAAQGKSSGTLYWRIPEGSPGSYAYQCQSHASMVGSIVVKDLSNL
jgi:plastocyanin